MAVNYIEPGTYVTELFKPRAAISPAIGFNLVIVGTGSKLKGVIAEEVIRGQIIGEALTVAASSPHTATLLNDSDEKKGNTTVYKDGVALPLEGFSYVDETTVQIDDNYYTAGSDYTIDYVSTDSLVDSLEYSIEEVDSIGLFRNSDNYKEFTDFEISAGDIDWDIATGAEFTGLNTETWDCSTLDKIDIALDGKSIVNVTITGAVQTAVTAAEVAADINTTLNGDAEYGADYNAVASDSGGAVKITAPNLDPNAGTSSSITLTAPSADSALDLIFGLDEADAPYEYRGAGKRPIPGQVYYASYKRTRPDEDYDTVRNFTSDVDYYNDIGLPAEDNVLSTAGELAWQEGLLDIYIVQVKDADGDGSYTDTDFLRAMDALVNERLATDVVVMRSNSTIRAKGKELVETESAQLKSNYKRYWCGVPRDTGVGDVDTADTLVYIAQVEFNVAPDSVARGRFMVVGPSNYQRTFEENTVEKTIDVDSNYMAVQLASRTVSFERASDSLFGKTFTGLSIESDSELNDAEKKIAAANGTFVLQQQGGSIGVYDALTTDASGDARYEEPSSSTQKDNIAFKVIQAVQNNLAGIVPDDVVEFIGTIKSVVGGVILAEIEAGSIGFYRNDEGAVRDIDYTTDVIAYRQAVDPRNYNFRYFFENKYPAKRFFGEFTVDFPFSV